MTRISRRTALGTLIGGGLAAGLGAAAFAQHRMRVHTATESQPLSLVAANRASSGNQVTMRIQGSIRIITSNGIPAHTVGSFPSPGNPNRIRAQSHRFEMPVA